MNVLGMRCSNKDFAWALLSGAKDAPEVVGTGEVIFPKGYWKGGSLKWFLQEVEVLLDAHEVGKIVMKAFEGLNRGRTFEDRIEHEAMVYFAGANRGLKLVAKKPKSTIAKDLGLKGRARYLSTKLDTSVIESFNDYSDKTRDAILAAWSELAP